jgi:trans-aconitate methyltransferase
LGTAQKWDPELYDAKHAFVWEKAKGVVDLLAAKPGERILDLGCGTGALTHEIACRGADVVGLDRSAEMIADARRKFPSIRFDICDARWLPFSDEFDAVFSNAALHWIPEPERVISGVACSLRHGGRFVAEFGGKGNVQSVIAALNAALVQLGISPDGIGPWYYPSIAEYASVLEKHGLETTESALLSRPTKLEDGPDGLRHWIKMFCGSFLDRVPAADHDIFLAKVESNARPALWKSDRWELDYRRLRIAAFKIS